MDTEEAKGNWEEQKKKLKEKFAALTDTENLFKECTKDDMIAKLQVRLGKTKDELLKIIKGL